MVGKSNEILKKYTFYCLNNYDLVQFYIIEASLTENQKLDVKYRDCLQKFALAKIFV